MIILIKSLEIYNEMNSNPLSKKRKLESDVFNSKSYRSSFHESQELRESTEMGLFYVYDIKKRNLTSRFNTGNASQYVMKLRTIHPDTEYSLKPINNKIKLFDMCLRFVALNLELVDSLVGFPSLIGETLYNECVKCNKFNGKNEAQKSIEYNLLLFVRAYPEFAQSLNLVNRRLALNNLKPVISHCCIHSLDLSNCDLANFDSNLADILKSSSNTLVNLNLSSNNLDETFLKKFTLSQRLGYVNFAKMETLDLRRNPILRVEDNILKYFVKYESLNQISISASSKFDVANSFTKNVLHAFNICTCIVGSADVNIQSQGWITKISFNDLISIEESVNYARKSSAEG